MAAARFVRAHAIEIAHEQSYVNDYGHGHGHGHENENENESVNGSGHVKPTVKDYVHVRLNARARVYDSENESENDFRQSHACGHRSPNDRGL